jgi:hypothetical protein
VDMVVECGTGSLRAKRPSGANETSPAVDMTKLRRVITVEKGVAAGEPPAAMFHYPPT